MIDGSEIIGLALGDFGVLAAINGGAESLALIPHLDGMTELEGGEIVRTAPFALADAAEVKALGIVAGNDGDTLTINSLDHTVLAIDPDDLGSVILTLEQR